jgi:hypothetical protein
MHGSLIIAGRTVGGHRDYLTGEPLSAGASIDLWDNGVWIPGRYEANFATGEAYFMYDNDGEEHWLTVQREHMHFRWPS